MLGPYTHTIDPVILSVAGVHLWWYGLSYALGFLNAHLFLRRNRGKLGLSLGCGRIGNFIDGKIVGSVTDVPWAVKFPEVEGFRHPVVLYDGLKNFLLIPVLMCVRIQDVPTGRLAALFVFLYAALRIPIDLLREYPITLFGLPTGQTFNIVMAVLGVALLVRNWLRQPEARLEAAPVAIHDHSRGLRWRRLVFVMVLGLALVIPSDATRDIPALYGKRHPGLAYSSMYPPLE